MKRREGDGLGGARCGGERADQSRRREESFQQRPEWPGVPTNGKRRSDIHIRSK